MLLAVDGAPEDIADAAADAVDDELDAFAFDREAAAESLASTWKWTGDLRIDFPGRSFDGDDG